MLRVGLNGFGRIGRAVYRINAERPTFDVVAINDLDPSVANHAYLLKYDSTYGRFAPNVESNGDSILIGGRPTRFHAHADIVSVPWADHGVDVIIDATGVQRNVVGGRELVEEGVVRAVVVTHAPKEGVDKTVIFGVNEASYDPEAHSVVSTSICDANAVAPVIALLEQEFGIEYGYITTLHPWLSYQNLVDGSLRSVTSPTHFWTDFALGRASGTSLIPKETSLVSAIGQVLPGVVNRLQAMSFRVPTAIVSASDMTIRVRRTPRLSDVVDALQQLDATARRVVRYETEPLVSIDYLRTDCSAAVDGRWTSVGPDNSIKLILWYDNEWGYSNRVVDMVGLIDHRLKHKAVASVS
jgi:glyceraldehyde 3-phosphate dehydrogenase